jgi:hypothetical protein
LPAQKTMTHRFPRALARRRVAGYAIRVPRGCCGAAKRLREANMKTNPDPCGIPIMWARKSPAAGGAVVHNATMGPLPKIFNRDGSLRRCESSLVPTLHRPQQHGVRR